jgi:hypothetical protein
MCSLFVVMNHPCCFFVPGCQEVVYNRLFCPADSCDMSPSHTFPLLVPDYPKMLSVPNILLKPNSHDSFVLPLLKLGLQYLHVILDPERRPFTQSESDCGCHDKCQVRGTCVTHDMLDDCDVGDLPGVTCRDVVYRIYITK